LLWLATSSLVLMAAAAPQDAEVTFYSNHSVLAAGIPGAKYGFDGAIFDGQRRIAVIRHGRFLTLHLPLGSHIFSASLSGKHPAANSQLSLELVENGKYFIRAKAESRGVIVIDSPKGQLDQVNCQIAHQEGEGTHPLEEKHVSSEVRTAMATATTMPPCG